MKTIIKMGSLCLLIVCASCKKHNEAKCNEPAIDNVRISIRELVYDSLMTTDTSVIYTPVSFAVSERFINGYWKVSDSIYPGTNLQTRFFESAGTYTFAFEGTYKTLCSDVLTPISVSTKIPVYDINNPSERKVSPYVGEFLGFINTNPADTFRIKIDFFSKESKPGWNYWLSHSNKPFYWINNFPKGFKNSTDVGLIYPELSNGYQPFITYKNLCVTDGYIIANDGTAHNIKGYSALSNRDSLTIDYMILDTVLYNQSRQIKYLKQKFIGIRK